MYSIICCKHGVTNPQNKTDKVASDQLKSDLIKMHKKSRDHKSEMISIMSVFHKELVGKKETEVSVFKKAFSTAYFLIIYVREFVNTEIKYFQHRPEGLLIEIFLTII